MSRRTVIVGAGATGLGAAAVLARSSRVLVVDRIPVPGGTAGWRGAAVRQAVEAARRAGAELRLGATAVRFDGRRLLVCGYGTIAWEPADRLVVATGLRPAAAAELGIAGGRPAGLVPVTVAHHLLETGVALWRRPVVVGAELHADAVVRLLERHGVRAIGVASEAPWADAELASWRLVAVAGEDRVESVVLGHGERRRTIRCDAVVLASAPRPARNVDGAISDGTPGVVFLQHAAPASFVDASRWAARRAASIDRDDETRAARCA
jgi:Pyridine nucleotide-disulphide oxidoreductase